MPFLLFLFIFWYWKKNITYEVSITLSYKREKSRFPVEQKVFDAKKKGWIQSIDRLQIILVAKKYISTCRNCSSVGCLKCVQFHNWFRLHYGKFEKPINISFEYVSFTVRGFGSTKNHAISKFESVWMWSWRSLGDKNKYNKNRATLNIFLSINVIAMFLKELFCY